MTNDQRLEIIKEEKRDLLWAKKLVLVFTLVISAILLVKIIREPHHKYKSS